MGAYLLLAGIMIVNFLIGYTADVYLNEKYGEASWFCSVFFPVMTIVGWIVADIYITNGPFTDE